MNYYLKRFLQSIFTVFVVISLSFVLIRLIPGGPMDYIMAQLAQSADTAEELKRVRKLAATYVNINPQEPMWKQYINYMEAILLHGDLGTSFLFERPVSEIMADSLPWTVFVMSISTVLGTGIAVVLGAMMAYRESSTFDVGTSIYSMIMTSIPYYLFAIVLVYLLSYQLQFFPTRGRVPPGIEAGFRPEFVAGVLHHAALPIASMVLAGFGNGALVMRGNSISVLGEDYLRVARLRGLPEGRISTRYVARNAVLPMYTGFMIAMGTMFGGSIIVEQIFVYPGVGYYMFRAIGARDYPLLMAGFILITSMVIIGVLIADLTYGKIDPRVKTGGEGRESF